MRTSREQPCPCSSGYRYIDGRFNPASDANVPTLNDDDGGQMSAQTTRGDMRRRDDQKFVRRARGDYRWCFFVRTGRFGFLRSSSAISDTIFSCKVPASACTEIAMRRISVRLRRICFFVFGFVFVFGFIAKSPERITLASAARSGAQGSLSPLPERSCHHALQRRLAP